MKNTSYIIKIELIVCMKIYVMYKNQPWLVIKILSGPVGWNCWLKVMILSFASFSFVARGRRRWKMQESRKLLKKNEMKLLGYFHALREKLEHNFLWNQTGNKIEISPHSIASSSKWDSQVNTNWGRIQFYYSLRLRSNFGRREMKIHFLRFFF